MRKGIGSLGVVACVALVLAAPAGAKGGSGVDHTCDPTDPSL
jgi:hypothetical protein